MTNSTDTWTRRGILSGAASLVAAGAASAQTAPAAGDAPDPRLVFDGFSLTTPRAPLKVQLIKSRSAGRRPAVIVLHERAGPVAGFRAIGRRLALDGYMAVLPDMMSPYGLTPEAPGEGKDNFSRLPAADHTALIGALVDFLPRFPECNGAVGFVSFQWGTGLVWPLLGDAKRVRASVMFDPQVEKPERWQAVSVPVQMHVPELDQTIAGQMEASEKRLMAMGRIYEQYVYPGALANFAVEMPQSKRYNRDAAELAFSRVTNFLKRRLV